MLISIDVAMREYISIKEIYSQDNFNPKYLAL